MSEEKQKIYIARDEGNGKIAGALWCYFNSNPVFSNEGGCFSGGSVDFEMHYSLFPNIKDGECYEAEIVLGEKV